MPYQALTTIPSERFRDFNMDFRANPFSGDLETLSTEDSIKQSLKNVVLTNFYERPFQTFFGSQVTGMLFELYDTAHEYWIRSHVYRICRRYEPRADILDVRAGVNNDTQTVSVQIDFVVVGQEIRSTVNVFFSRVR